MVTPPLDARAYRTAERLLRHNRGELVLGGRIRPRWIEDGARFSYTVNTVAGKRFILVDPATGVRGPAFDHERLAAALAEASGQEVDAAALPFPAIEPATGAVEFDAFGTHWRCELDGYECRPAEGDPPGSPLEVRSPDGKTAVYRAGYDLRARSVDGARDWALTDDGTEDLDYGANPDYLMYSTLLTKLGLPHLPPAVAWSPDSTRVLTHRTDLRGLRRTHLVRSAPGDGGEPGLITQRTAFAGDDRLPLAELVVIDVVTGQVVPAQAEPVAMPTMSPILAKWAWWAEDGSAVYYLSWSRDARTLRLHRLDPATGAVRTLLTETGATRVEPAQQQLARPAVRVLSGGEEVLWYSQRDGWGHLYLYRAGAPCARVTSGPFAVREILHVDERRRVVWFTVSGLVAADPYRRTVCRAGLDGTGFTPVSADDDDHAVTVPPNAEYFVDSASSTATPPVITVRDWDGRVLVELERADITRLTETGWRPPERFRVTAEDGTDVWGLLYRPHGFDPAGRYPVIDTPFGIPTGTRVNPSFDPGYYGYDAEVLAALGFAVIAVDGRGSPGRDKAFHDASYGNLADACGLADHVTALRQLAATRPWLDLDRVGVTGMSGGGFAAVRAMLSFPEVFTVGVAESGMHDFRQLDAGLAEAYNGPYDADSYTAASNVDNADALTGKLLLIHGGLDDRVSPHLTLRLAERLVAADKDFELFIVPDADHIYFGYEHQVNRRKWNFLVRHLLHREPPAGYRLTPAPVDLAALADLFG
ncbi:MAG TPA: prolyl oligopeptidase family serine peptidase [Actinophytocola sp.]|uniref:S9 family peptidase n=1 Tax=Actinophytocola sp. TaxID=1872138 RepID=UPI002DBA70E8|nr:prolyl oligopeptidase family serine peptidase [Actinophytocola sp.]HEU5471990.1 prolyl oligopeptidase family serine peptidase [Actinophytocola sp.]